MTIRFLTAMRKATAASRAFNTFGATRLIQNALSRTAAARPGLGASPGAAEPVSQPAPWDRQSDGAGTKPVLHGPAGAFTSRSFSCDAGARAYKLYVPDSEIRKYRGLVIMLHGCTQDPDDFAAGTCMNAVADREGLVVAYPAQTRAHNASGCWNWFQKGDQVRDKGEPAILAGIARELMDEFDFSRDQAFIAGLSAGGAMAVIMAETYPDLFSAVGVHSGLPYQSATNVMSALAAMRGQVRNRPGICPGSVAGTNAMRTIIFHGSADKTVHPANANCIAEDAALEGANAGTPLEAGVINGRRFTRAIVTDPDGKVMIENWSIEGAGHAWSGGSPSGTFADPRGPDASAEMVRFFLEAGTS
jgi:poly(hydroxyalkanoate) depolymerase family esterase